jgi:hypothetical protein
MGCPVRFLAVIQQLIFKALAPPAAMHQQIFQR